MGTRSEEEMGLVDGPKPLSTLSTITPPPVSVNVPSTSAMPPPSVSTPLAAQVPPQLGQCVYVLSPWGRGRTVFAASQPNAQGNALLRLPHPGHMGLLRLAPYRPYFPTVPSRSPGAAVPRDFPHDFRYAHDFYNGTYPGGVSADYNTYASGQDQVQQSDDTAVSQPNYEPMYPAVYPSQGSVYSTYGQQQCWSNTSHTATYGTDPDKTRTLAFYPQDRVAKVSVPSEYIQGDGSNSDTPLVNVTKKGVRVKFMGPEAMYLTTKTLEMQPRRSSVDGTDSVSTVSVVDPLERNQVYNSLHTESNCAEGLELNEVIAQTPPITDEDTNQDADEDPDRVTFDSIEDALASIDPTSLATDETIPTIPPLSDKTFLQVSAVGYQGLRMADEKQEEVIKAAKSLFSKRTRTLYHWLYPQTSKNKLKATVSAAWDTLAEMEKQFYVSQVLGRFGLQASSLMINPQLDGIKGLPTEMSCSSALSTERPRVLPPAESRKLASAVEAQQAVDQLFASCADSENWTSFCGLGASTASTRMASTGPSLAAASLVAAPVGMAQSSRPIRSRSGHCGGQTDRRKRSFSRMAETGGGARLGAVSDQLDEEVSILKRMREAKLEADLEEDSELTSDLDKFRVMAQDGDRGFVCRDGDDFWRRTPDPEDLFTHLEF